jgi:hypothetical protein
MLNILSDLKDKMFFRHKSMKILSFVIKNIVIKYIEICFFFQRKLIPELLISKMFFCHTRQGADIYIYQREIEINWTDI